MAARPLTPDEAALWARAMANVRPFEASNPHAIVTPAPETKRSAAASITPPPRPTVQARQTKAVARISLGATLDGTWDRQLSRGLVVPDRSIDLHGHSLNSAHAMVDAMLDGAIRAGDRLILLVTGKPPVPTSERPHDRGAIRAAVGDWLSGSRHAASIAAVRNAHPRHGGTGALYIVLRKPRQRRNP